jgi:hypothetical protein
MRPENTDKFGSEETYRNILLTHNTGRGLGWFVQTFFAVCCVVTATGTTLTLYECSAINLTHSRNET